jgi:hypothetical protein
MSTFFSTLKMHSVNLIFSGKLFLFENLAHFIYIKGKEYYSVKYTINRGTMSITPAVIIALN